MMRRGLIPWGIERSLCHWVAFPVKNVRTYHGHGREGTEDEVFPTVADFRFGSPTGKTRRGIVRVQQGQRIALYRRSGAVKFVNGPARKLVWGATPVPLQSVSATSSQFIRATKLDGSREYIRGPARVWEDPLTYQQLTVMEGLTLKAQEAIVLYKEGEDQQVERRILEGPAIHIPGDKEWLHVFSWHGHVGSRDGVSGDKVPNALIFTRLRLIPSQMYFDIPGVRTGNDALLTVKVMVFYALTDVERMLEQTHDPIGDFINSLTADVMDFAAHRTFEEFKAATEKLSLLETYPQLVRQGKGLGYDIQNVVLRGYTSSDALQRMHDEAIEARTRLQLEKETEEQTQELSDFKLVREVKRMEERQKLRKQEVDHEIEMQRRKAEGERSMEAADRSANLAHERATEDSRLLTKQREIDLNHIEMQRLQEMGVDVTQYLVARVQQPNKLVQFVNQGDKTSSNQPVLHLHEGRDDSS